MKQTRFLKSFSLLLIFCLSLSLFAATPVEAQSLKASPSNIEIGPDKKITVTFSGMTWPRDSICLFKVGESYPTAPISRKSLQGKTSGTIKFWIPLEPGSYEFQMWDMIHKKKLATSNPVSIDWGKVNLKTSPSNIEIGPNKKITVTFSGAPGWVSDSICLFKVGESYPTAPIVRKSLSSKTSGTIIFDAPQEPGSYEFQMWDMIHKKKLGTSNPVSIDWGPISMKISIGSPDKKKLSIQYSGAPGYKLDFIGLYKAGETKRITYKNLSSKISGTIELVCPTDTDSYEIQLWANNGVKMLAKTQAFIPKNGPPPPVNQDPGTPQPPTPEPPNPSPAPDKPFTLRAYPGHGKVLLEWTPPQDTSNVIGYNLYRNTSRIPYGSPITDFPITG
ncbi:MAG: hypothetical protein KAH01_07095, partial [Caldisericia bacterium]|nr:hypothetical protein [Caldisericia bacterium]